MRANFDDGVNRFGAWVTVAALVVSLIGGTSTAAFAVAEGDNSPPPSSSTLGGTVVDEHGAPFADVVVRVYATDAEQSSAEATTDAAGAFEIEGANGTGDVAVEFVAPNGSSEWWQDAATRADAATVTLSDSPVSLSAVVARSTATPPPAVPEVSAAPDSLVPSSSPDPSESLAPPELPAAPESVGVQVVTTATITGHVRDFTDAALAGVPVTAYRVVGLGTDATLESALTVSSGADGSYALAGLQPNTYAIRVGGLGSVYPALWVTSPSYPELTESDSFYAVRFPLTSGQTLQHEIATDKPGSLQGTVSNPVYVALGGVKVTLYKIGMAGQAEVGSQVSQADGSYQFGGLVAGEYQVVATVGLRETIQGMSLRGGTATCDLSVRFDATVGGVVRDGSGSPLEGAVVEAVLPSGVVALDAVTDASGAYLIRGLEAGRVTIRVSTPGRVPLYLGGASSPLNAQYLSLMDYQTVADANIQFPASPRIGGEVVDSNGTPVAGATIFLISKSDPSDVSVQSAVDGSFAFAHVAAGSYTLEFVQPDGSPLAGAWYQSLTEQGAVYFTVDNADVDLGSTALGAGGMISGTVVPQNSAYGATVTLHRWSAGGVVVGLSYTDFDPGAPIMFEFTNLVPGDYTVSVTNGDSVRWLGGTATAATATSIALAAGQSRTGLSIAFPHYSGAIAGKVTPAPGVATDWSNAYVYAETLDGSQGLGVVPSSDGRFTISGLAPGTYRVAIFGLKGHVESWYRAGTTATPSAVAATSVTVTTTTSTVNFVALAANSALDGQLLNGVGEGVPHAVVTLIVVDVDGMARYAGESTTDKDGRYYFQKQLLQGEYYTLYTNYKDGDEYWASAAGASVRDITDAGVFLSNAAQLHFSLHLAPHWTATGAVLDRGTNEPVDDIPVTAVNTLTGDSFTARTAANGFYSIDLRVGTYSLRFGDFSTAEALHGSYAPEWYGGTLGKTGSTAVHIVDSDVTVEYAYVERGALISGTVGAAVAPNPAIWLKGALVKLFSSSGELLASTEVQSGYLAGDAPGAFRFRVKAGTYKVCVTPPTDRSDVVPGCWNGTVGQAAPGSSPSVGAAIVVQPGDENTGIDIGLVGYATLTTATPTVTGKLAVGSTLSVNTGTWTTGTAFAYKWFSSGVAISGATKATLTLTSAMLGKKISVSITGSKPGYHSATKTSAQTAAVVLGTLASPTPTITGAVAVGFALTAVPGTWTTGTSLKYQWYASGVAIAGATTSKLVLSTLHKDKQISVRVTGTLAGYTTVSRTSALTGRVATTATPIITGAARVGAGLSATHGVWTVSTAFAYQWYADGVAIAGATKSTFVPTIAQDRKALTIRVTGTKAGYATVTRSSAATLKVMRYSAPTITGALAAGYQLTANPNTWSTGTTFTYQWYASGIAITGATKSTLVLTTAQRDKQISVKVTGKQTGFTSVLVSSAATAKVATVSTPTITGVFMSGATLTAKPNTWTTGTTFTYQWYADGVAVAGATLPTLVLGSAQVDKQISVIVTGHKSGYGTVARGSAKSPRVAVVGTPTITGTLVVGSTLSANPGTWTPATVFSYQWYANGVALSGATASTLTLTAIHKGKVIMVHVTGSLSGYQTIGRNSGTTSAVQ